MRWSLATVTVLLAALALSACGSDPDPEPPSPQPSTAAPQPSFAAAADALCAEAQADQEGIRRERGGNQITLSDRARLLVELVPSRVRLGEMLAELQSPPGEAQPAEALIAAAERRGIASAEAGERWRRGADRERIAEAAAREHDERERFVAIAGRLGLSECAEVLPAAEVAAVEELVEGALADPDPRERCARFGSRYLEQEYGGGVAACVTAGGPTRSERAAVADVTGIAGVFAGARATVGGRPEELRLRITVEDGEYRVDKVD